jgi:hypothetical protein
MRISTRPLAAAIALTLGLGLAGTAEVRAQSATTTPGAGAQSDFSDRELKQFAMAALEVQRINNEYSPKLQTAATAEERQRIETEALGRMAEAVQDKGLSVDSYKRIYRAAQADPKVAKRIGEHVDQVR